MKRSFILLVSLAALACGGDPSAPESVAGTYKFQSVAGEPLPATLRESPGFLWLVTAGSFQEDGSTILLDDGFGTRSTGSLTGNVLTLVSSDGVAFVYRR